MVTILETILSTEGPTYQMREDVKEIIHDIRLNCLSQRLTFICPKNSYSPIKVYLHTDEKIRNHQRQLDEREVSMSLPRVCQDYALEVDSSYSWIGHILHRISAVWCKKTRIQVGTLHIEKLLDKGCVHVGDIQRNTDFVKKVNIYLRGNNKETIGPLQCEGKSNISKTLF